MKSQILKFKDMPFEFQRVIVIYHGEDDSVDWTDIKAWGESNAVDWFDTENVQIWIDDFIKVYADKEFRIGTISIEDVIEKIMPKVISDKQFDNFKEYHEWYYDYTDHGDSVFPIVVSQVEYFDGIVDFIEDGWHRFHSYVEKGLKKIPFVEYV